MSRHAWLRRLAEQLPGWHVWYSSGGGLGRGWYAVPAPDSATHIAAVHLKGRIGWFRTPQELRAACRLRYAWHDYCESCGVLARECGHRRPEQRVTKP